MPPVSFAVATPYIGMTWETVLPLAHHVHTMLGIELYLTKSWASKIWQSMTDDSLNCFETKLLAAGREGGEKG